MLLLPLHTKRAAVGHSTRSLSCGVLPLAVHSLYVRFRFNGCNGHGGVDWRRQSSGGFSLNEGIVARWFSLVGRISVGCFECVFVLGFLVRFRV
ncbi:hypothetical protein Bca4012_100313 [Brassica carinata]